APPVQAAVALARLQALPQVPQLASVVLRLVSQPLPTLPSQLPKPAVQAIWQAPPTQLAAPFVVEQALPQAPQCEVLVLSVVSQPLATLPSQLPKPALQAMPQAPPTQLAAPFAVEQMVAQVPQWPTSVWRFTSQPLPALPS